MVWPTRPHVLRLAPAIAPWGSTICDQENPELNARSRIWALNLLANILKTHELLKWLIKSTFTREYLLFPSSLSSLGNLTSFCLLLKHKVSSLCFFFAGLGRTLSGLLCLIVATCCMYLSMHGWEALDPFSLLCPPQFSSTQRSISAMPVSTSSPLTRIVPPIDCY